MTSTLQQTFIPQTLAQLVGAIEAVLFVRTDPVDIRQLAAWTGWEREQVVAAIDLLERQLERDDRGLQLLRVAGGIQLATKAVFHPVLQQVSAPKPPPPLSRAALETLAVIAYRQPVTRAEVERLRGVRSQSALYALQDRELIEEAGRADLPGRPILYRTTDKFLHWCGIDGLAELPPLPDPDPSDVADAWMEAAAAGEQPSSGKRSEAADDESDGGFGAGSHDGSADATDVKSASHRGGKGGDA